MARTQICPAPGCQHHGARQPLKAFRAGHHRGGLICATCRSIAAEEGLLGTLCLQCRLSWTPGPGEDRALCNSCRRHLDKSRGAVFLVTSAPTSEGAILRGRYLSADRFQDCLTDAVFEPGTIAELYNEWQYQGAYRVCGAQSLAPDIEMEPQQLVIVAVHRPRGDGRIFRP